MALQEKHRTRWYAHLVEHVGEETAEAVLGEFPARDLDEPVTKEFVALAAADLRAEIGQLRTEMHTEFGNVRTEMHTEIGQLRTEMHTEFGNIRTEMHAEFGKVRTEMAEIETRLIDRINTQTDKVIGRLQVEGAIAVIFLAVVNALTG